MTGLLPLVRGFVVMGAMVLAAGCNRTENPSPSPGPSPQPGPPAMVPETGPHVAGKRVFNANCTRCHAMGGGAATGGGPMPGGKGKIQGPDLSAVARDPGHTPEWLGDYIRSPRSQKPDSRMPPFQGKISDDDFKALIDYLSSLK
jgi:mono/diheme cytochrome c family protein